MTGGDHNERLEELRNEKSTEEVRHAELQKRWEQEKQIVGQIAAIRQKLEQNATPKKEGSNEVL